MSALELVSFGAALGFVVTMIMLQVPVAAATGAAVILVAATIGLPHKGKPFAPDMIGPAWQGLA